MLSPIDGAPLVVKANCAVEALPWTAALKPLAGQVAERDSQVVSRLRAAGACVIGAANMHEAALGVTTTSPLYGPCFNPLRAGFTPGGSSGGSAAAVAAGFCAGALGTDTMGSVRIPSAFCGVAGFKPSYGRVSTRGVIPLSPTLDHVGFHGQSAADVAQLYAACAGFDPEDGGSIQFAASPPSLDAKTLRVGAVELGVDLTAPVAEAFARTLEKLRDAGVGVAACDLSQLDLARMRRKGLLICEAELLASFPTFMETPSALSAELRAMLAWGAEQKAPKLAAAYAERAGARRAARRVFKEFDILILPTAFNSAFPASEPAPETQADLTVFANFAGLPAACVPVENAGLPASLQVWGPHGEDMRVLDFAAFAEQVLN